MNIWNLTPFSYFFFDDGVQFHSIHIYFVWQFHLNFIIAFFFQLVLVIISFCLRIDYCDSSVDIRLNRHGFSILNLVSQALLFLFLFRFEVGQEHEDYLCGPSSDSGQSTRLHHLSDGEHCGQVAIIGEEIVDPSDLHNHRGGWNDVYPEIERPLEILLADPAKAHIHEEDHDTDDMHISKDIGLALSEERLLDVDSKDAVDGENGHWQAVDFHVYEGL